MKIVSKIPLSFHTQHEYCISSSKNCECRNSCRRKMFSFLTLHADFVNENVLFSMFSVRLLQTLKWLIVRIFSYFFVSSHVKPKDTTMSAPMWTWQKKTNRLQRKILNEQKSMKIIWNKRGWYFSLLSIDNAWHLVSNAIHHSSNIY